jgi:hypothetical protein
MAARSFFFMDATCTSSSKSGLNFSNNSFSSSSVKQPGLLCFSLTCRYVFFCAHTMFLCKETKVPKIPKFAF